MIAPFSSVTTTMVAPANSNAAEVPILYTLRLRQRRGCRSGYRRRLQIQQRRHQRVDFATGLLRQIVDHRLRVGGANQEQLLRINAGSVYCHHALGRLTGGVGVMTPVIGSVVSNRRITFNTARTGKPHFGSTRPAMVAPRAIKFAQNVFENNNALPILTSCSASLQMLSACHASLSFW